MANPALLSAGKISNTMMRMTSLSTIETKSCHIGPEILPEQFISEHMFIYILAGEICWYIGNKTYTLKTGEYFLARKNYLGRHYGGTDDFKKVIVVFDQKFLKNNQAKHQKPAAKFNSSEGIIRISKHKLIPDFIHSLTPYYNETGKIDETFADVKREELLIILLQLHSELSGVFFDYGIPGKIDLEEFMNRNYKYNVNIERFAFLTGRSISAFKRDFKAVFSETPNRWLLQKRLQEAYFLIDKRNKKPSEFYLDLGFEDLSHFSFAFKKLFGVTPTELAKQRSYDGR
jgi:AraC-like DNA-binding protein